MRAETAAPVKRDLILVRLYYFVSVGATGFLFPFLSLFFHRQGLSGAQIGLLGTVQALVSLISAPFSGNLSDRFNRPRRLIQLMLLSSAMVSLMVGRQDQFIWLALLVGLHALVSAGLNPLSDNLASTIAGRYENVGFGSIRLWGSLGWTMVTAVAGRIIEQLGIFFAFVGYAVGQIISAGVVHFIPQEEREPNETGQESPSPMNLRQGLLAIRRNQRLKFLALGMGFAWLFSSGLYQFEAIYLDDLGASETIIGLANALNAFVELPAMLLADRLLKRFSPGWLLRGGLLLQAGRMIGILAFPSIPMIMAMRVLMGIQFSFYSVGVVGYLTAYSNKTYRVTALALITVTLRNLMTMIGNPISGLVYDFSGAYWLYALGLVGAVGGWFILWLNRNRANYDELLA